MRNKQTLDALQNVCDYIGDTSNMTMVEIGCYQGESTQIWCENFKKVFAIDPWVSGKGYDENDYASKEMKNAVETTFDSLLKKYDNLEKIKNFSYEVFGQFEDESLDFVYIDGEHTYDGVNKDIELYLPKIKKGGYIAGHDYKPKWQGVMGAVNDAFKSPDIVFDDNSWLVKL